MSSISGIKKQAELERLPFLNKKTAEILIGKKGRNLDKKIDWLFKKGYLISLKKGLYTTERFYLTTFDKKSYLEYLANILRHPSYLSLEYVLSLNGLIPEGVFALTSITLKSSRMYENKLGTFIYRNVKKELFCGYRQVKKGEFLISQATVAKALFDFLYLKRNLSVDLDCELNEGLRINWDAFTFKDLKEFENLVQISKSLKMERLLREIKRIKNVNKCYNLIMNINHIKNTLSQQKTYLCHNFLVKDIGIFGSVVKNQSTKSSDIDLLVEFIKPVGFFQFTRLEDYLSGIFKKNVDLVTKDALKPPIKDNILKEVIYV